MNKKISQLNEASSIGDDDLLAIVQSGETKKLKKSNLESDPVVGAVNGMVKSDGAGNIASAVSNIDYAVWNTFAYLSAHSKGGWAPSTAYTAGDFVILPYSVISGVGNYQNLIFSCLVSHTSSSSSFLDDILKWGLLTYNESVGYSTNGIIKSDGAGNIYTAVAGTDYLAPNSISGSFTTTDGKTITISDGLITAIED